MVDENKQNYHAGFFQYYEINWLNWDSNIDDINLVEIDNHATNIPSEIYNSQMNELIWIKTPRISYLLSCMFQIRQLCYIRYCDNNISHRRPGVNRNIFGERIRRLKIL